jgi:ATP-binding cassette subfamily C protein LapB
MLDSQPHPESDGHSPRGGSTAAYLEGEDPVRVLRALGFSNTSTRLVAMPLDAVREDHMPCAVLLKSGRAIAIGGIAANGNLLVIQGEEVVEVARSEIAPHFGGSVILAHEGEQPAASTPDPVEPKRQPDAITVSSLFWHTLRSPKMTEIFLVAIMTNLFMFALPLFSMAVYDRIIPHKAYETLWALATGILILLALDFVSRTLRNNIQDKIAHRLGMELQTKLFARVLATDLENAPKTPTLITSAFQAVEALCQTMPGLVVGLLIDLPFVIALFVYIGITANWVVVVPLVSAAIIVMANVILHFRARKAHAATLKQSVAKNILIEETVSSFGVAKVTASEVPLLQTLSHLISETHEKGHAAKSAANHAATISNMVIQLNTVFALVAGVFVINGGGMTTGALISAVMLSQRGISPLIALVALLTRTASLSEPLALVNRLAALPEETQGDTGRAVPRIRGQVDFSGVTFRYSSAVTPALKELNLTIRPGEKVGVIGSIGSGKSSLLKLILRLHNPELGGVLIDGHDARQYAPEFLRRQIAYMPQDCDLFETTIRENIVKGLPFVDETDFEIAVRVSGVQDIVTRNPAGYDLQVGKFGRRLSGGERQAVCLARALVRPSPVLLMDEPTSSMDSQMERGIINRLSEVLDKNRTFIVATHRAPLLSLVDRVIWLEQGRIVADGTPADVMARASKVA